MISKFNKMQNSWFFKGILILTALSFMSLFGIAGYIGGTKNQPVIKVGSHVVYQNEIAMKFEQELQITKSLFGDNLEINDTIRTSMLQGIVQRELEKAIIDQTADRYNVHISDDLIRKIIYSQPEFMDENGRFSADRLKRLLSISGWTEQRYVDALRTDIKRQHLVQNEVENINIPKVMTKYLTKIENQKKVFDYIKISQNDIKVDRKISNEELNQYYQDFIAQFMEPEKRDVSFIALSIKDIENKTKVSDAEVEEYYNNNIAQFETPEKRTVLQMVFDEKIDAEDAFLKADGGDDFYRVAEKFAKQTREDTDLGEVSKDMLIADISDAVFKAKTGDVVGPIKSEFGWHIMKVNGVKPGTKTSKEAAAKKIVETLKAEKSFDEAYVIARDIEDKIGGGKSLREIAKDEGVNTYKVSGISEGSAIKSLPLDLGKIVNSDEFIDTAFSYNVGEVSQVVETDDGFFVLTIDKIIDSKAKDLAQVKGDIEKMWLENEKSAIAQELVNDVMADLENGEELWDIAQRFHLNLKTTAPLKRSDNFEKLSPEDMLGLFQEKIGTPKLVNIDKGQLIVVAKKIIDDDSKFSDEELQSSSMRLKSEVTQDFAKRLIKSYGDRYDVRVKYRLLGLAD